MITKYLTILFLFFTFQLAAQTNITGTVTSAGELLIGATVFEEGTENGTLTDLDGRYQLTVSPNATLKIEYLGYITQSIAVAGQNIVNIELKENSYQLKNVIVTAFGIEKEKKATGFAYSEIGGDELNKAREVTVAAQLIGKVAGLEITKPSNGPAGSTRIIIRGLSQLSGDNRPLIVIDGIPVDNTNARSAGLYGGRDSGDGFSSINPDDIENITVLKGPSASALYGSRGGNGVVLITTKKGTKRKGIGIEYTSNYTTEKAFVLPNFQEEYGQGANGQKPTTQQEAFDNWRSWGAKLDGSPTPIFNGDELPYSAVGQDDIRDYYQRGNTWTNSLSFAGGNEVISSRLSLSQLTNSSIVPNASYDRYTANFNIKAKVFKKISLEGKANYAFEKADNRTDLTDNPGNPSKYFTIAPANLPHDVFEKTRDENGDPIYWSQNPFTLSPYWGPFENQNYDNKGRFLGLLSARWEIIKGLSILGRVGTDESEHRFFNTEIDGTQYLTQGAILEDTIQVRERNFDIIANYNNKITNKIDFDINAGATRTNQYRSRFGEQGNGFIIPQLAELSNLTNVFDIPKTETKSRINALFATTSVSFNDYLYLEGSIRKDYFSVLTNPRDAQNSDNSVLYASGSLSFILSDAIKAPDWLSFAKLRMGYGTSGFGQIRPYSQILVYNIDVEPKQLPNGEVSFGNIRNDNFVNPELKPSLTTAFEFGVDLKFIDSRFGIDFTVYRQNTNEHIFDNPLPSSTGFNRILINAGEVQNQGIELSLNASIIRTKDFEWALNFNYAKNENKIISLNGDLTQLNYGPDRTFSAEIVATNGGNIGDIWGNVYARNDAGEIIHVDGLPQIAEDREVLGNFTPDWYGGLTSTFSYKNLSLSFLIDTKQGGKILSTTSSFGYLFGRHINSLEGRDSPDFTIVGKGVDADGISPNTTPANITDFYERLSTITEENVYDASYIKFRQLSISYSLNKKWLEKTKFIQGVTVSLVGRNLFFISNGLGEIGLDPESIYTATGGDVGIEYAALPATRSYGINLNVKF